MEPNPSKYPILNHLYRLPTFGSKPNSTFDIENPLPPESSSSDSDNLRHQLSERMPHLNDPDVVKAMKLAVSDVSQTRSVLQGLGDRPDHETVDKARSKIAEIDAMLSHKIEQLVSAPKPQGVDPIKWQEEKEIEFKLEADKEKKIYKAIVNLDEMHQAYENLLADAENRLEKIYSSATLGKGKEVENEEEEEVNEEVIEILQKGEKELERVDLSMRKLRVLPEAFGRLSGLISLRLSENELKTLPDSVGGIENLEELYLSSNLLESLPDSIGLLVKLKILDVASNKLKALPDSISHCRSLEELDASYNSLMYLPTNIGYELGNLVKLSVHYNKLRSLPSSICEMRSLRYLDAHFNELQGLPYAIGRLTSLEILNLSSNFSDLEELPETFGDLINLKELDLSNNQIHVLPNTFGRLDKMTKLNLDQNPIFLPPVEVVNKGVEAVKEFMAKRWLDILVEEELNYRAEADNQAQAGWLKRSTTLLTRSTSALGNWASTVSESVSEYLGGNSPRESYLNQQL